MHRTPPRPRPLLLGTLVVALAACGTSPVTPPGTATSSAAAPTPVSAASPTPVDAVTEPPGAACAGGDLAISSSGWGGAAGSRGADITLENRGAAACTIAGPAIAVVDAAGAILLRGDAGGEVGEVQLGPDGSIAFSLLFGNWCDASAALPLRVVLVVDRDLVPIDGLPLATPDDLPPCNGEGEPATLSSTPWSPG